MGSFCFIKAENEDKYRDLLIQKGLQLMETFFH